MEKKDLDVLKRKVKESLDVDRHALVMKFQFIGGICLKMNLIPTRDALNPTACTDGKNIYFDCAFYTDLSPKERVFVLGHEIWHCVMLHLARKQTRDQTLWNIATDMEVNHLLELNAKDGLLTPPPFLLFPPKRYEGKSAEFLYDKLLNKMKKQAGQNAKGQLQSSASCGGRSSNSQDCNEEAAFDEAIQKSKSGKGKSGKLEGQFDTHKYVGEDGN